MLRTTRFDNLDLTIVEHGRDAGYSREEVWGTTPVRIIGPVPQTDISQLYAKLDVLLAPSIWPESYGLVTREAKASGLWVIASNLGAIGEDVDEGVDGFRIDVSSPKVCAPPYGGWTQHRSFMVRRRLRPNDLFGPPTIRGPT